MRDARFAPPVDWWRVILGSVFGIAAFVVVGVLQGQPAWQELLMGVVVIGFVQVIMLRGRRR
jgi:hypothetical protein